jgi:hypothetical protein
MGAADRLFNDFKTLKNTGTTTIQELTNKRNLISGRMSHVKALAIHAEEVRAQLRGLGIQETLVNPHEAWMRSHNVGTYDSTPRWGYDAIRDTVRQINSSTAGPSSAGPSGSGVAGPSGSSAAGSSVPGPSVPGPSGSSSNNN